MTRSANDFNPPPAAGSPPGAPAGAPYPAPPHKSRTGWIILLVGAGCLVVLVIGVVIAGFLAFWTYDSSSGPPSPPQPAFAVATSGFNRKALPHAGQVTSWMSSWSSSNSNSRRDDGLQQALKTYVFTDLGQRAEDDVGTLQGYEENVNLRGNQAKATVILDGQSGKKVRLTITAEQAADGSWTFNLDQYELP